MNMPEIHSPLDAKMGVEVIEFSPTRVAARYPVAGNTQPFGLWHGGASGVVAESLASMAAFLEVAPNGKVAGVSLNVQHLKAVTDGYVTGVATPVRVSGSLGFYAVELRNDDGELVATAQVTVRLWRN